jgi:hypothetical protein
VQRSGRLQQEKEENWPFRSTWQNVCRWIDGFRELTAHHAVIVLISGYICIGLFCRVSPLFSASDISRKPRLLLSWRPLNGQSTGCMARP